MAAAACLGGARAYWRRIRRTRLHSQRAHGSDPPSQPSLSRERVSIRQGIDAGATPQQLAGKVLVEMMRMASDASPANSNSEPVCAKLITLQGCGVALASIDYVPETMSTIVPLQYDINNVVPKYLVKVYDSESDAGHVQPTGTDFKSTSLKLLEAVSNCKDNDHFFIGSDTTSHPCADALKAIDADEYAHKVRSILEKEYATHPSEQMNSLLQKAILAETAASMAPKTNISEGSPLEGIFIFCCVMVLGAGLLGTLIFVLKMQGKPTDGFLPVTLPKPNFPTFSVATGSKKPGTPTKADPSENLRSKLQRLREERSARLFKE